MKRILKISGKSKVRRANREEVKDLEGYWAMGIEGRLALIQELMPLGVMHIKEELQAEVRRLAGDRYKRNGMSGYCRWTRQKGSVYIKDQKVPIMYQRVRDTINNKEVPLSVYERFQEPKDLDELLLRRVLYGLSTRNYRECAEAIPGALSLSPSTVSRRVHKGEREEAQGASGAGA